MSGSAAGNPAQIFEDDPHEDAVVLLYLAVVIVAALGHGLDEEALVLIGEADRGQQGAVLLNVAPMAEADRPVLIEARGAAEGHLLAAAELVGAVVVVDEELGEVEVQGRRADPGTGKG